ncbi:ubiquinone/menaquinone biosynthesis C-methylase UbiE [Motilibacter peucedani]|uniref:Ubiquinone/menaquinone biosynthesis C-methylase UbiE n=1 Tax=Motilibacter peucedani TaxID=598650 RepID=A0A420XVB2_9ACTN|nr:class I SAM-dependent methyltransferase [Motilibacter peucedani]RKS84199.1 ubiquinone/menaquinone biosynthesis C-methylase UbiE [Motilibacter peucedani]
MSGPDDAHAAAAASFGAAAGVYERARPDYPAAALDWLLPPGARRVLDLGAGTGKLTRLLRARGLEVTAVEPSAGMRAELERAVPGVRSLAGRAEQVPLADGAVDAVLVAQAWHWVDPAGAVPEVARVLAPGGRLGLVWNVRDESHEWVARLGELLDGGGRPNDTSVDPQVGPPFGQLETRTVAWTHETTPEGLVELAASRSYVILLPEDERAALLGRVRSLLASHPDLAGRSSIALPYLTRCYRAALA